MAAIEIKGIPELQQFMASISQLPTLVLNDMAAAAFGTMRAGAGRHSPRPSGTGFLFRSLFRDGKDTLTQTVGHDLALAPYAQWVVLGSVPHVIRPKNAKALSWIGQNGRVFRRFVNHPGYIGDNYRDTALDDALARMAGIVDQRLKGL